MTDRSPLAPSIPAERQSIANPHATQESPEPRQIHGREWKPGDVAMVSCESPPHSFAASRDPKGWVGLDPSIGFLPDYQTTAARPLVVIDPEDVETLERLGRAWSEQTHAELSDVPMSLAAYRAQAALATLVAPPKPAEPTGLGAVVEDAGGKRWTRYDERDPQPWWRTSTGDPDEPIECRFAYADIHAVRVLSDGVIA